MNKKHILQQAADVHKEVPDNTLSSLSRRQNTTPPSKNGFQLTTQQLHDLLTNENKNTQHASFENAVIKQQQLLKIVNTLDRQHHIQVEINSLVKSPDGVDMLDRKTSQFKSLCPAEVLSTLRQVAVNKKSLIPGCESILKQYHCLLNELIQTPLQTLAQTNLSSLNEFERNDWYNWCTDLDRKMIQLKNQIKEANLFFTEKTFDMLNKLAKDTDVQQQLANVQHLFVETALEENNV